MRKLVFLLFLLLIAACTPPVENLSNVSNNTEPRPDSQNISEPDPVKTSVAFSFPGEDPEPLKKMISEDTGKLKVDYAHYQYVNTNFDDLRKLDVDYLIIDFEEAEFSSSQLDKLKEDKTVLSYLSIGEAETYRPYWGNDWSLGNPDFIDEENPNWPENYKVKYWDPDWQLIILERVELIALQGYDGVYLDIVDAYAYYEERGRTSAAEEMIDFIAKIRSRAKVVKSNFLIVPQNAEELYAFEEYKRLIDGLGREDVWYDDNLRRDSGDVNDVLDYLEEIEEDGKFVIVLDYPSTDSKICRFYEKCSEKDFICSVSNRALDRDEPLVCKE